MQIGVVLLGRYLNFLTYSTCKIGGFDSSYWCMLCIMSVNLCFGFTSSVGISVLSTVWLWLGTCFYVMKKPECQRCRRCCCSQPQDIEGETQSLLPAEKTTTARQETWRTKAIAFLRAVLPILGVFLPITVFWALMFQQNSTWVAQGLDLDCYLGSVEVPPGARAGHVLCVWAYGPQVCVCVCACGGDVHVCVCQNYR